MATTTGVYHEGEFPAECDNCEWTGLACDTRFINDIYDRLEAGGTVPVGECPECGALAYYMTGGAPGHTAQHELDKLRESAKEKAT